MSRNSSFNSTLGKQLYALLPEVFRNRDNPVYDNNGDISKAGDMAAFLEANGLLLDRIKASLQQRLSDSFPDSPIDGQAPCQDWLLPYFADLLDVQLVSPDAEGQRQEIAHAIAWRKAKGTLSVVESISETLTGVEAELQEGWRRVAITPRIGAAMRPDANTGMNLDLSSDNEVVAAIGKRYPGLPIGTTDLRWSSRSIQTQAGNPLANTSRFAQAESTTWLHANPHATPCFANSYEDVSRRSVDLRQPNGTQGHAHPNRLLIYMPPFRGFFETDIADVSWRNRDQADSSFQHYLDVDTSQPGLTVYRNKALDKHQTPSTRGAFQPVRIHHVIELGAANEGDADTHTWRFEGVILEHTVIVHGGRLELDQCAARKVELHSAELYRAGLSQPLLSATHCLFKNIENPRALSRLEYCTVLERTVSESIEASDCIFIGYIQKDRPSLTPPAGGCVRYSRVHPKQAGDGTQMFRASLSRDYVQIFSSSFGEPGCGVLHPESSEAVCFGAEDGGEMGAYHQRNYCLRWQAVRDKLNGYIPLNLEPVLIPDPRLLCKPPLSE